MPGRNDAEMGPANSIHASAYYSEYNERFDFDLRFLTAISNTEIVQGMWFCPTDRLPVIGVVLFSKQILRASIFSEQVVVLKIRHVSYIGIY